MLHTVYHWILRTASSNCYREFTTNVGPVISEAAKSKGIPASVVVREVMSIGSESGGNEAEENPSEADQKRSALLKKFSPNTIKSILELLCDESVRFFITILASYFLPWYLGFLLARVSSQTYQELRTLGVLGWECATPNMFGMMPWLCFCLQMTLVEITLSHVRVLKNNALRFIAYFRRDAFVIYPALVTEYFIV